MLELKKVTKRYANEVVVDGLDLVIQNGEFFSLLGPSGCGKTTLLRMISGLETVSSGEIYLGGQRIDNLPAQDRPFNMVFQRYALFPHLTVSENVAFGLKLKKLPVLEVSNRVEEALVLVNMLGFRDRLPETLSGGQSQRVAIARALVNRPKVLLLDEPLSALDQKLREHMQTELKLLQRRLGLTFIYVTHDQEEALALSDRVAVMNCGRTEQVSSPKELYDCPQTFFTAQFVGAMNKITGETLEIRDGLAHIRFQNHILRAPAKLGSLQLGPTHLMIRPEKVRLLSKMPSDANWILGKVIETVFRGTQSEVIIEIEGGQIVKALVSPHEKMMIHGSDIFVTFQPEDIFLFQGNTK